MAWSGQRPLIFPKDTAKKDHYLCGDAAPGARRGASGWTGGPVAKAAAEHSGRCTEVVEKSSPVKILSCRCVCKPTFYNSSGTCTKCADSCAACKDGTSTGCQRCSPGKILSFPIASSESADCVSQCVAGSECAGCGLTIDGSRYCTRCKDSSMYPFNGVCILDAKKDAYCTAKANGVCTACSEAAFLMSGGATQQHTIQATPSAMQRRVASARHPGRGTGYQPMESCSPRPGVRLPAHGCAERGLAGHDGLPIARCPRNRDVLAAITRGGAGSAWCLLAHSTARRASSTVAPAHVQEAPGSALGADPASTGVAALVPAERAAARPCPARLRQPVARVAQLAPHTALRRGGVAILPGARRRPDGYPRFGAHPAAGSSRVTGASCWFAQGRPSSSSAQASPRGRPTDGLPRRCLAPRA
ncbi:Hypothetical protein GLP15_2616 [Giardia lamblia P15]|uniref:Variant-specific surface protein n=1 Tax=Giardia intestinalis (strain P15) TaxID=658858 RepID=E1F7U6_GIAIA|nr:Hypothetical protein GLP15_2616 [Giardia lamblia P15]